MKLTLRNGDRVTTVGLIKGINSVGERYHCPHRRMRDALRRIGALRANDTEHNATEIWAYHGGYFVSFEPKS